jgi:hypothetical protein
MGNAIPTLPADLKITLGVAKILCISGSAPHKTWVGKQGSVPSTNHPVEDGKYSAGQA